MQVGSVRKRLSLHRLLAAGFENKFVGDTKFNFSLAVRTCVFFFEKYISVSKVTPICTTIIY